MENCNANRVTVRIEVVIEGTGEVSRRTTVEEPSRASMTADRIRPLEIVLPVPASSGVPADTPVYVISGRNCVEASGYVLTLMGSNPARVWAMAFPSPTIDPTHSGFGTPPPGACVGHSLGGWIVVFLPSKGQSGARSGLGWHPGRAQQQHPRRVVRFRRQSPFCKIESTPFHGYMAGSGSGASAPGLACGGIVLSSHRSMTFHATFSGGLASLGTVPITWNGATGSDSRPAAAAVSCRFSAPMQTSICCLPVLEPPLSSPPRRTRSPRLFGRRRARRWGVCRAVSGDHHGVKLCRVSVLRITSQPAHLPRLSLVCRPFGKRRSLHRRLWGEGGPHNGSDSVPAHPLWELVPGLPDPIPDDVLRPAPDAWPRNPWIIRRHRDALTRLARMELPPPDPRRRGRPACRRRQVLAGHRRGGQNASRHREYVARSNMAPSRLEPVRRGDLAGLSGVEVRDLTALVPTPRVLGGWEAKTVALLACGWDAVFYLDADAYCVNDPAPLLERLRQGLRFSFGKTCPARGRR